MAVLLAREGFAEQLWRYGEAELAVRMLDTDDATYRRVMEVASSPTALRGDERRGVMLAEMSALGAIEVLTGEPRRPQRRRRLPESSVEGLWAQVGRERDRRARPGDLAEALRVVDPPAARPRPRRVREATIETPTGTVAEPEAWLPFVLRELQHPDGFVVVDDGRKDSYAQARNCDGVLVLEYRDGSPQRHHQARDVTRSDVARALSQWLEGRRDFVQEHAWRRLTDWD